MPTGKFGAQAFSKDACCLAGGVGHARGDRCETDRVEIVLAAVFISLRQPQRPLLVDVCLPPQLPLTRRPQHTRLLHVLTSTSTFVRPALRADKFVATFLKVKNLVTQSSPLGKRPAAFDGQSKSVTDEFPCALCSSRLISWTYYFESSLCLDG